MKKRIEQALSPQVAHEQVEVELNEQEQTRKWKAYEKYKDSGIEWLGEIPAHWNIKRIKEIMTVINGYPFASELFNFTEGKPLIRIRDLANSSTETYYAGTPVKEATVFNNDILIGMDGDFNVCWWQGGEALLNQRLCCIREKNLVDKRFIYYLLRFPLKLINDLAWFTTVKHLSSVQISSISFGYPPFSEQRTIVAFLNREITRIDDLITKKEQHVALLQERRTAIINQVVTKGLNVDVPMKDSGVEWWKEIPEHWEVRRLKFIADTLPGATKGKDLIGRKTVDLPYLRVANVQDGYLDLSDIETITVGIDEVKRYSLKPGDVLMNEGGDFDKLGRGFIWDGSIDPCLHQNHVFAVRPFCIHDSSWINTITQASYAKHYFVLKSKQSTNLASISKTNIQNLPVILPPIKERLSILAYLEQETTKIDKLITGIQESIKKLKEYSTALISAVVSGKIDVRGEVAARSVEDATI
jgi:type I restriction enzyme S subunit